jgi:hypothetical protein
MFYLLLVVLTDLPRRQMTTFSNYLLIMCSISNTEKMPYLGPNTVFRLRSVVKIVTTFLARPPIKIIHQGLSRKGDVPPSVWGWGLNGGGSPPHRQENFGHVIG